MAASESKEPQCPAQPQEQVRLGLFRPEMTDEEIQAILDQMAKAKPEAGD